MGGGRFYYKLKYGEVIRNKVIIIYKPRADIRNVRRGKGKVNTRRIGWITRIKVSRGTYFDN